MPTVTVERLQASKILISVGTKKFLGTKDIDYSSSTKIEESLIKEDAGKPVEEIISFEDKFSMSGIICIQTGTDATHADWAAMRTSYRAKASIAFVYGIFVAGAPEITGNLIITGMSEKSGSDGKATWSLECKILQDSSLTFGATAGV